MAPKPLECHSVQPLPGSPAQVGDVAPLRDPRDPGDAPLPVILHTSLSWACSTACARISFFLETRNSLRPVALSSPRHGLQQVHSPGP